MSRVLTVRALNRALLARQRLLEPHVGALTEVIAQVGGIQAQYAPSTYIGVWSRLQGIERPAITSALEARELVQATLLRATIHVVTRADFHLFSAAVRRSRRAWVERVLRKELVGVDVDAVADRARALLAGGPLRAPDLQKRLVDEGVPVAAARQVGLWVDLVRVPPSGTWERRRADLVGLADAWVGPSPDLSEADALVALARRYLGAFGPASVGDFASWAGVPMTTARSAVGALELRRFEGEDGAELLDLPDAPLPDEDTPAPVRFLPTWDATLLVHARRTQLLPERHRPRIFGTKTPHSFPTFLVDGAVAGTWRYDEGQVRIEPFEDLPTGARDALEAEAARLAAFHDD